MKEQLLTSKVAQINDKIKAEASLVKPTAKKRAIKVKVSTKVPGENAITDFLYALIGIFMIVPAMIYGGLIFFSAGFEYGLKSALKMYTEVMEKVKEI